MPDAIMTEAEVGAIGEALGLLSSALRSGEPYSPEVTTAFNRAAGVLSANRPASPSVRLARWLDADPMRDAVVFCQPAGQWYCRLADGSGPRGEAYGRTRDAAVSAALDQAEGVESDA